MARPKRSVDKETILKAEKEFRKLKEGKLAMQLRVIMAFGDNKTDEVARMLRVSPRSIFRWVNKFNENGLPGLREKPKGHYKARLTSEQKEQIKEWIIKRENSKGEKTHWTLKKLKLEIYKEYKISIGTTTLWRNLRRMGLVVKNPRPIHFKADKQEQEVFKKK